MQDKIVRVTERTKKYSGVFMNLAIAYGGRQEIIDASRRIAHDVKKGSVSLEEINESLIRQYFWTNGFPDPDLVIRTGGEKRLSNFLTFQSTYSELVFLDKLWPDFEKKDFSEAVKEFSERQRRFGK